MYDLTVDAGYTFAVGSGGWVVHNADPFVDLASPERRTHILDGDATGGSPRAGSGLGKSQFPAGWSDDQTMHHISDVATDPSLPGQTIHTYGNIRITGVRDSTTISVHPESTPWLPDLDGLATMTRFQPWRPDLARDVTTLLRSWRVTWADVMMGPRPYRQLLFGGAVDGEDPVRPAGVAPANCR